MIVRWTEVMNLPNDVAEPEGRLCECGKKVKHETVELYAISDGRLLEVKRVNTAGNTVRIWLDV